MCRPLICSSESTDKVPLRSTAVLWNPSGCCVPLQPAKRGFRSMKTQPSNDHAVCHRIAHVCFAPTLAEEFAILWKALPRQRGRLGARSQPQRKGPQVRLLPIGPAKREETSSPSRPVISLACHRRHFSSSHSLAVAALARRCSTAGSACTARSRPEPAGLLQPGPARP